MTASARATTLAPSPRLYSQCAHDHRGNFDHVGDLYRAREPLDDLVARIDAHLRAAFDDARFAISRQTFAGGRSITAELLEARQDLSGRFERDGFVGRVRDQIERFGFTHSNIYSDYMSVSFYAEVKIGTAYWASLARKRSLENPVERTLSLAAFKRRLKPGDMLILRHSSLGGRLVGVERKVIETRSNGLVLEGPSYLDYPRAANFACDGRLIRIAIGSEHDPDAHLLYEWKPAAAAQSAGSTAMGEVQ